MTAMKYNPTPASSLIAKDSNSETNAPKVAGAVVALSTSLIVASIANNGIRAPNPYGIKTEYRRLKAELAKLQEGEKVSTEQYKAGLEMMSKLKLVALDLEDEMVSFEQENRYLESISSAVLNRMRAIR